MRPSGKTALLFLLPGCLLLASCSIFPTPEVTVSNYYDLSIPEKISTPGKTVIVTPFASNSGERYKMALRVGNSIRSTESCKWIMPPGSLMTKYLRLAFRNAPGAPQGKKVVTLSGSISAFESNKGKAVLGVTYKLRTGDGKKEKEFSRTILIREKFEKASSEDFAAGMSRAAGKVAQSIAADLKKL